MIDLPAIHALAVSLAREAGDYALAALHHDTKVQPKGDGIDVITAVDVVCEQAMIDRIRMHYPEHGIKGEEHGLVCNPDADVRWLLDPLDGTNNYVMGMPMFGNCITVLEQGQPVVACVHDSVQGITTSAWLGGGAWRNGAPTHIGSFPDLARTTISWTQGYGITADDLFVQRTLFDLEQQFKRVLRTWSPSIDWGLIAAGHVGAFVTWQNELHDLIGGELIVAEAGGEVWHNENGELVIAGAPEVVATVRRIMSR